MKSKQVRIYEYSKCSTCRKAVQFLESKKIPFEAIPIVDQPPTESELRSMLKHFGGEFKKLFNTSGQVYRELNLSARMKSLTEDQAISLLKSNGKLIKRPFVTSKAIQCVGFNEAEWKKLFLPEGSRA